MSTRIIRLPEVCRVVGQSRSSVLRQEAAGTFPKKRQISQHSIGWIESEVFDWVRSRVPVGAAAGAPSAERGAS